MTQLLRVFISSPSDVEVERQIALQVIKRIGQKYQNTFELKAVLWEREPLLASGHFQDALDPATADIMVCILWSRLGSPLPERFTTPDGRIGVTGTEWEFEHALTAINEKGTPDLMVYRKTSELTANINDPEKTLQIIDQKKQLDDFFDRQFHNQDKDHTFKRAFFPFETSDKFEQQLEIHLTELLEKRLESKQGNNKNQQKAVTWHQGSPFRGLEIFDQEHQAIFFSRTHAIGQVMAQFKEQVSNKHPFLMLLGMSGSGKSSLLNAGLLPLIQTPRVVDYHVGHIRLVKLRPSLCEHTQGPLLGLCHQLIHNLPEIVNQGYDAETLEEQILHSPKTLGNTFKQLTATLQKQAMLHEDVTAKIQLTIDQFEELFTNKTFTAEQRESFCMGIKTLLDTGYIWCICTMRSDFNGAAEGTTLIELMRGKGQYTLQPPKAHEIEKIINEPAKAAGLSYEVNTQGQSLGSELCEATVKQVGALPLLEFCLKELFIQRNIETQQLTYSAYERIGKLEGAISQRAEQEIEQLQGQVNIKQALPNVFHALISINPDNEETATSRYMPANQFSVDSDENIIIQTLVNARLLVTNEDNNQPTIRIAHEALITHWQRVKNWLIKDIEFLKWHARTERDVNLWQQEGKINARLLQKGKPLADAESFLVARKGDVQSHIQFYIQTSIKRIKKKQQINLVVIACTFFILLGLTGWAVNKSIVAEKQKNIAQVEKNKAKITLQNSIHNEGLFFAGKSKLASIEHKKMSAIFYALLAKEKLVTGKNIDIEKWLATFFLRDANYGYNFRLAGNISANYLAVSPDGKKLVTSAYTNEFHQFNLEVQLWDIVNGKLISTFPIKETFRKGLAVFSFDGKILAIASDFNIQLWNVETKSLVNVSIKVKYAIRSIAFSPDGQYLASIDQESAYLWDARTGELLNEFKQMDPNPRSAFQTVSFSPDSKLLAVSQNNHTILLWNVMSGKKLNEIGGYGLYAPSLEDWREGNFSFSPDGKVLATGYKELIRLYDVGSGQVLSEFEGHSGFVDGVTFSSNGLYLASGARDGTIRLWDVTNKSNFLTQEGFGYSVHKLTFSTDQKTLVTQSSEGTQLWDIGMKKTHAFSEYFSRYEAGMAFSLDEKVLAIFNSTSNEISVLDIASMRFFQNFTFNDNDNDNEIKWYSPYGKNMDLKEKGIKECILKINSWKLSVFDKCSSFSRYGLKYGNVTYDSFSQGEVKVNLNEEENTIEFTRTGEDKKIVAVINENSTYTSYKDRHFSRIDSTAISPSRKLLASIGPVKILLWDLTLISPSIKYLEVLKVATAMKLNGINSVIDFSGSESLSKLFWSKHHPFHWLPKAEQGDGTSMIELGNLYLRDDEISKAKHWFNQALALPEFKEVALERLSITEGIVEYAEAMQ